MFLCLFLSIRKEIGERNEPRAKPLDPPSNSALLRRVVGMSYAKMIRARGKQRPLRCAFQIKGDVTYLAHKQFKSKITALGRRICPRAFRLEKSKSPVAS